MTDLVQDDFKPEVLDAALAKSSPVLHQLSKQGPDAVKEHLRREMVEEYFGETAPKNIRGHLVRLFEKSDPRIEKWRTHFPEKRVPIPHEHDLRESARALLGAAKGMLFDLCRVRPLVGPKFEEICIEWIRELRAGLPELVRSVQGLMEHRYFKRFPDRQKNKPLPVCEDAEIPSEPMEQWLSSEIRAEPDLVIPLERVEELFELRRESHSEGEGAALSDGSQVADAEALPILFEDYSGFVLPGEEPIELDYRQRAFVQALAENGGRLKKSRDVIRRLKEIEGSKAREKIQADKVWGIRTGRPSHVAIGPLIDRTPGPGGGNRDALWRLLEHQVRPRS